MVTTTNSTKRGRRLSAAAMLGPAMLEVLAMVVLVAVLAPWAAAGHTIVVGRSVAAAERRPLDEIDHARLDKLLARYVDRQGQVAYADWKASSDDRRALSEYLEALSAAEVDAPAPRAVRLAFWINAYNALTIYGILREYPTPSIRRHTSPVGGYNIWEDLHLLVGGRAFSLSQIEHEVLRKLDEPRIHFAIVCASLGCPRLRREAYTPDELERQLEDNARAFFADPGKCRLDPQQSTIELSPILKWFADDFGADPAQRLQTIAPWLPAGGAELVGSGKARVRTLNYDWKLNDRPPDAPQDR